MVERLIGKVVVVDSGEDQGLEKVLRDPRRTTNKIQQ